MNIMFDKCAAIQRSCIICIRCLAASWLHHVIPCLQNSQDRKNYWSIDGWAPNAKTKLKDFDTSWVRYQKASSTMIDLQKHQQSSSSNYQDGKEILWKLEHIIMADQRWMLQRDIPDAIHKIYQKEPYSEATTILSRFTISFNPKINR